MALTCSVCFLRRKSRDGSIAIGGATDGWGLKAILPALAPAITVSLTLLGT
jgi:hypothetical protein